MKKAEKKPKNKIKMTRHCKTLRAVKVGEVYFIDLERNNPLGMIREISFQLTKSQRARLASFLKESK